VNIDSLRCASFFRIQDKDSSFAGFNHFFKNGGNWSGSGSLEGLDERFVSYDADEIESVCICLMGALGNLSVDCMKKRG